MSSRRADGIVVSIAAFFVLLPTANSPAMAQGAEKRYAIVFHQSSSLPQDAEQIVRAAGATATMLLPQIGVVSATSSAPDFAGSIGTDARVAAVEEDDAVEMDALQGGEEDSAAANGPEEPAGSDPQPGSDNLYSQQWDKMRMNVSMTGSYAVQRGRPEVVVAVLDTGIEKDHPDISPNLDTGRSRSFACVPGSVPCQLESVFDDFQGHGTHMASLIAAPINTIGISGVAPNVTLVALKVIDRNNRFSSFAHVASALIYAAENRFDVANMSFAATLSRTDSELRGRMKVLQRAANFARAKGVTLVAALGNSNADLRDGRASFVVPAELDGVIGVSSTGYFNFKVASSNYGVGKTDISAPGGSRAAAQASCPAGARPECPQRPPSPYRGGGQVLGAWSQLNLTSRTPTTPPIGPGDLEQDCINTAGGVVCGIYRWWTGTSMSAAQVSGVAALVISQHGDFIGADSGKPHMSPTAVEAILQNTANNQLCPDPDLVVYLPMFGPATCRGDAGYNSFFGKGIVDALKAVTTYANH
jgi:lantibiotic leader peptide-processing serine protease